MILHSFSELHALVSGSKNPARAAVAAAADEHTLEALFKAKSEGIVSPILIGDAKVIREILKKTNEFVPDEDIYDIPDPSEAAVKAVSLIREGKADLLMKGKMDTSVLLKEVVNKNNGLNQGKVMSHVTIFELPSYHKLISPADGGVVLYPTLEQKKAIIENTVSVLRKLGYDCPKVGVLACVEKVNPKMPETLDAAALKEMNRVGEIKNCIVEGPISYDCAMNREIADLKGFESPVSGDCDILLAPNIHTGNIMGKMLTISCGALMAGIIVGASCPIVMTSRGSSASEKYWSIVLAAATVSGGK